MMDVDLLRRLAQLAHEERALKARLKATREKLKQLQPAALEEFLAGGVRSIKVQTDQGVFPVFLRGEVWARVRRAGEEATPEEVARTCAALEAAGLGWMVAPGFSVQTLSAWVRERFESQDEEGVEHSLPPDLAEAIEVTERSVVVGGRLEATTTKRGDE